MRKSCALLKDIVGTWKELNVAAIDYCLQDLALMHRQMEHNRKIERSIVRRYQDAIKTLVLCDDLRNILIENKIPPAAFYEFVINKDFLLVKQVREFMEGL